MDGFLSRSILPDSQALEISARRAELTGLTQRREKTRALNQAVKQEFLTGRPRLVAREGAEIFQRPLRAFA
jgi:hypothetical protein